MGEEGELKKRMMMKYIKSFLGSGELWYNYFWEDDEERKDDEDAVKEEAEELFFDIIDEAKKDFPKKMEFGFNADDTKVYDVWDWFDKWFGE